MKILVTGGAGFIGSNFISYILNKYKNYYITNLDALTYAGNLNNTKNFQNNPNYNFVQGNINDENLTLSLLNSHDVCINFAAESHVDNSIKNPKIFVDTNVQGTHTLLNNSLKANLKLFIQISTDEVYGSLDKTGYFTEETNINPNSPYSASKAAADMFCRSYFETFKFPVIITRCSNNYGPNQHAEKLIPTIVNKLLNNQKIPIYGDGSNIRDWLYVKDNCYALDLILHKGKIGEVYNIGCHNEKNNLDLAKEIIEILNKDYSLIEFVTDRLGHDKRYAIDYSKIQKELGYKPQFSFSVGIQETINSIKERNN